MSINRRQFGFLPLSTLLAGSGTKMSIQLSCGSIGVKADQRQAISYAAQYGFQSVEVDSGFLASLEAKVLGALVEETRAKGVQWGCAGMPVDFRRDDESFRTGLADLPRRAAAIRAAGATRMGTWISPGSDTLAFSDNMKVHAARLRQVASVLEDQDCRLGLEYVGPKTSRTERRHPFVHSMKGMRELIAAIGKPNVGFVLDSWHWYTAGETLSDLKTLKASEVILIDLNDAPAGIAIDEQIDSKRALPCETGVIDVGGFLSTLNSIGCDAPARCEPFSARLRTLPPEQALQETATAMKKAFGLMR
ncbi:MAG TPA: TIM barrel protein [Bryobacteraceae bacterium]|nr:TIM barrel protein [Bryobacteraceae bacterium]HPT24862.1 TIM barrel protein [Bryobacteraceae bacterium]